MGTTPTTFPPPFRRGPQCFSDFVSTTVLYFYLSGVLSMNVAVVDENIQNISTFAFLLAIYVLVLIVTMMTLISICLQVIDYLCSVSLLTDEGHSVSDVEEALLLNDGKDKLARIFLQVGYPIR